MRILLTKKETTFNQFSDRRLGPQWQIWVLSGKIIFISPHNIGAHDQREWNLLHLRDSFENKPYEIIGDGGFSFNRCFDTLPIKGLKPKPRTQVGTLSDEDKIFNKELAQYRVIVENTIGQVKK